MTRPAHAKEHEELAQLIGKLVRSSDQIDVFVLITIGKDGIPCMGGNVRNPRDLYAVLHGMAENESLGLEAHRLPIPEDN